MQQLSNIVIGSSFEEIEDAVFANLTSFKGRLDVLSVQPITSEAAVHEAKAALDKLMTDMQAFSNSLTEGPRSGFHHLPGPVLGTDFAITESIGT